jgi:hypothetical protein
LDWTLPETAGVGQATVILQFPTQSAEDAAPRPVADKVGDRAAGIPADGIGGPNGVPKELRAQIVQDRFERNLRLLKPGQCTLHAWRGTSEGLVSEAERLEHEREDKLIEERHEAKLRGEIEW